MITCGSPDGAWHADNVTIDCTASDAGSGLASGADASFGLSTSVPAGTEDANAATGSREICDAAGNCASAGPIGPIAVDRKPPAIAFTGRTPANADGWNSGDVTVEWSCADGGSGVVAAAVGVTVSAEGADQAATGTCADNVGNSATDTRTGIAIDRTAPTVEPPVFGLNPKAVAQSTSVAAVAADGLSGVAGGELFVGADPGVGHGTPLTLLGTTLTGTIGSSFAPGVYTLCVRSRDRAGNWSGPACAFLVVYDPTGAFVTGSGRIDSPAGAYRADLSLVGRADFGFVSKYKQGAATPSGNTRFQFKVAGFDFNATSYDWLVVAGARAQFKGTGTVNGTGDYGFLLTAIDGDVQGGAGVDRFRIKIWDRNAADAVVYDNQAGAPDDADATTASDAGAITIHK